MRPLTILAYVVCLATLTGCDRRRPDAMTFFVTDDMMTGSNADGTLASGDATCRNWKSTDGQTILGHSDRAGGRGRDSNSWNSAHPSEGCTLAALNSTGGSGLFYCFATN